MNKKGRFPLIAVIILATICIAIFCILTFSCPAFGTKSEPCPMSPWFILVPIFAIAMFVIYFAWCRKKPWGEMCNWGNWRRWSGHQPWSGGGDPAEILKARLAKGEISEDEYDRLLEKIQRETPAGEKP